MTITKRSLFGAVLFTLTALFCFAQVAPGVGSPGASAGGTPAAGPGSGSVTNVSIVPSSTVTGTVDNPTTTPAITLTAIGVIPPASGNVLISGGGVEFTSGLNFTVGGAVALIQGTSYTSAITNLTAAAADPTNTRTDVVYLDATGAHILEGIPGNPALTPQVDPATQLYLTQYDLTANATVLPGTINTIYQEDAGPAAEWTASKSGSPVVLNSTNNPFRGTKDIEGTAVVAGNSITFTAPATFDPATYASDIFYVAPKAAWPKQKQFSVQLLDASGNPIGSVVTFKDGSFGFNSSGTANAYQQVSIPMTLFGANGQTAQGLKLTLAGGGGSIGFYMDSFTLQAGLAPVAPGNAMVFRGDYASTTNYAVNDVVTFQNTSYIAIAPSIAQVPPTFPATSTFWKQMVNASFTGITSVVGTANETAVSTTSGVATVSLPNALTFTAKTVTGGTFSGISLSGITTQSGTTVTNSAAMGALVIDVAQRINTKTVGADTAFTFSGTPGTGQWFGLEVTNSDTSAHTLTIPSSFLVNATPGGVTTTQTLPASGKLYLNWRYDGSTFNLYAGSGGTPGGSSGDYQYNNAGVFGGRTPGTGVNTAFQNATNATGGFVTFNGALGTPTSGTLTNATGLSLTTGVTDILPVANGGTATATPGLVQGTNITITGTWPNQTIAAAGGGSGTVTTTGSPSSGQAAEFSGASSITGVATTGTGNYVKATSPTLVTPTLGAATATTINGNTLTTGSSTYTGTAAQTYTMPATSATLFGTTTKADTLQAAQLVTLTSSGTDTYAGTAGVTISGYTTGALYTFVANFANVGAASLNIDGKGARTIKKAAGGITTDLADNDIRNGQVVIVQDDGTNFQMQSTLGNASSGGSGTVNSGTSGNFAYYATTGTAVSENTSFKTYTDGIRLSTASGNAALDLRAVAGTSADPFINFDKATTTKAYIGVASNANAGITGSAIDDMYIVSTTGSNRILFSNTGSNINAYITTEGYISPALTSFKSPATNNARNPIWSFVSPSTAYGISYFAGSTGYSSLETFGFHFGTATLAGCPVKITTGGLVADSYTSPSGTSTFSGAVSANAANGFQSTTSVNQVRNPIWSFGNASAYGISYFAGLSAWDGVNDSYGFHFGTATSAASVLNITSSLINSNNVGIQVAGDVTTVLIGRTIKVKSGTNALAGTVTLSSGVGTISSTAIDSNTVLIPPTIKTVSGTQGDYLSITLVSGGYTITSKIGTSGLTQTADGSTYNWVALKVN